MGAGKKASSARASHLALVPGEVEAFSATKSKGCCNKTETSIVVTDKRILLMEKRFSWGAPTFGLEEAFPIDTLKFVSLSHGKFGCLKGCCMGSGSLVISLNFSSDGNIMDWQSNGGKVSGCRRFIKLRRQDAQEIYNQIQAMLQARLDSKLGGSGGSGKIPAYMPPQIVYPQAPPMGQQYAPAPQMYAAPQQPPAAYQA